MKFSFVFSIILVFTFPAQAETMTLWLGTGSKDAKGIYQAQFDTDKGTLSTPSLATEVEGPGWVSLNSKGDRLYAVCKIDEPSVAAYAINGDNSLTFLNSQPIGDGGAAHVSIDNEDRILFTAQYGGGSTASYALNEDGTIGKQTALIEHTGTGPNQERQTAPHPHWTGVSPDNRFLFVPDLGSDKVMIYKINHDALSIEPHGFGQGVAGGGPRHMKFSPDGSKIYLLNELLLSVTAFDYNAEAGTMEAIQTIENVPQKLLEVPSKASEIRVHPSGKFVYAANRGHDTITVFSVDDATGKLTFVEREAIRGSFPRNFNLDPSGRWLIAAGRHSNTLAVFEVNQETGGLRFTGEIKNCPDTICIAY